MNPFTRFLTSRLKDRLLHQFVAYWDRLEALVIRAYRRGQATREDVEEYRQIRPWLQEHYPRWQEALRPYWREALVAGEKAHQDPFLQLLAAEDAADFVQNWTAMQTLPAAREALNKLVVATAGHRKTEE